MLANALLVLTTAALASLGAAKPTEAGRPCGLKISPCPRDQICIPDSPDCADLDRCRGTCQKNYPSCGGHRPNPPTCDAYSVCKDDPRIPNNCGMACDRPGICIPKNAPSCAGFIGKACPQGLICYDAPNDGCDPRHGGADCPGVCL